ncbi:hypothetical protein [Nocardia niigatensis]|uniref:hypothetical protein n=1 Tax=Nocardia niigatensis TaxID=209249 RepID=UPI0012F68908|nr:hypothetical protein [Nocardia niigatensis]
MNSRNGEANDVEVRGMREYDSNQVEELLAGSRFIEDPTERTCPACGNRAVRTYVYRNVAAHRTTRITYTWCAVCRRFKGWTGPDLGELAFSDPLGSLSPADRREMEQGFDRFFETLDKLWSAGELPQKFARLRS